MSEATYDLKTPFDYAYKGEIQPAKFITFSAPTYRQVDKVTPIKQALMAAIKQATEGVTQEEAKSVQAESDDSDEISARDIMQTLFQWTGDLTSVMNKSAALFKSGAALIEGETKFNNELLDKVSMSDFEGMVGTYLANFIVPSLKDGA